MVTYKATINTTVKTNVETNVETTVKTTPQPKPIAIKPVEQHKLLVSQSNVGFQLVNAATEQS
jgi:hypothetical protein